MLSKEHVQLGIAPIGWTNDDLPDLGGENTFEQCISEMALAGYAGCEIGNKYPKDSAALKPYLDIRGLTICNAWFSSLFTSQPYEVTEQAFIAHRDRLHVLGAKVIGASEQGNSIQGKPLNVFGPDKPVFTPAQWRAVAEGYNRLGQLARDKGMTLTIHHHMGTGIQTLKEIDTLMDMTDPDLVYLLFDTGHLVCAGEDPAAVLQKYVKRTRHVHLKDVRAQVLAQAQQEGWSFLHAVREGMFTVPGDGSIDFAPLFAMLKEADYRGWMVVEAEQDPAKANPFAYAVKARQYIREQTGL